MDIKFSKTLEAIDEIGLEKHRTDLYENANSYIKDKFTLKNITMLKGCLSDKPTIIVSAGPSLIREGTLEYLTNVDRDKFHLVCIDASLARLLRNGMIPDYCLVLDPHPTRMLRWFGDPDLEQHLKEDDYFARQDLDTDFRNTSAEMNAENINLINKFGHKISLVTSACISPNLFSRLKEINFGNYYGFVPLVDNPSKQNSITRDLHNLTKLGSLNTGGNVGCCAWVFCQFLGLSKKIGAIGFDYSYYNDVSFEETQTYRELKSYHNGKDLEKLFVYSKSPSGKVFFQDPTFYWYCDNFLTLLSNADRPLYNLTNAGLLYGQNVKRSTVKEFFDV